LEIAGATPLTKMADTGPLPTPEPKQATCSRNQNPNPKAHTHLPGLDNRWTIEEHNEQ